VTGLRLKRPTLLVDEERVKQNIARMSARIKAGNVRFRPHFKTHQSAIIGDWFRDPGIGAIAVSSVQMATYFADHGWKDITIALTANRLEIEEIAELSQKIDLSLLLESEDEADFFAAALPRATGVWIKIDVGYKRTGLAWDNPGPTISLAKRIARSSKLRFDGILTHAGHAYRARSREEIEEIYRQGVSRVNTAREQLKSAGFNQVKISFGDTPTCSLARDFSGVDEVRCGNFVFYDVMQFFLGSCRAEDIAVALACPVLAKHAERHELVIYGGAVHLSKDSVPDSLGRQIYGLVAPWEEKSFGPPVKDTYVSAISQEHGIIKTTGSFFSRVQVGDIVLVLPVHACLTADLMRGYLTLSGQVIPMAPR